MAKIDDLGLHAFPPTGTLVDWNESKRVAYLKGVNDTLIALTEQIKRTDPRDHPAFINSILKFIEGYYE